MRISRCFAALAAVLFLAALTGCSYPIRNTEADVVSEFHGYQWTNLERNPLEDTAVIVTASGGGTRATALVLSVLRGLDKVRLPGGETLMDEIDIISSVSGGSVTAGYFALAGRDGFQTLEDDFIRKDGMSALLWSGLNPYGLAKLSTNGTERIDLLIDYLDRQLFKHATYQTLLDAKRGPFLILNAADMVEGMPFALTQRKLGLLCSELTTMSLSTAVAASAAFPVALSPVTLKNYQPCKALENQPQPPKWVGPNLDDPDAPFAKPGKWYNNPRRTMLARTEYAYWQGARAAAGQQKLYIHLLDGGIADNLGIFEPYRMLTTPDTQPTFLNSFARGRTTKLIFVVINARSFAGSELDASQATPGMIDTLMASISAPIDRTTAGTADQLRNLLFDEFRQFASDDPVLVERFQQLNRNTAMISIDFDAIADQTCRRKFQGIATSWALGKEEIDSLLQVGEALLANDPQFSKLLAITGAAAPDLPGLNETCENLAF